MSTYRISGVWKDSNNVITHYAFHTVLETGNVTRSVKKTKADAVALLETKGNTVTTWIWNSGAARWNIGEDVTVVQGAEGKFLRSNPDNKLSDNLLHLINFDWIAP